MDGDVSVELEHRLTDPARWNEQYGEYRHRYTFRHVGDCDKAQDRAEEIWLAAWQARARFARQSSEQTCLVGILRHKVIDHVRIASRGRPLSEAQQLQLDVTERLNVLTWPALHPASWMDPVRQLEWEQLRGAPDRCLCRLSDRMKAVFALCDLEEAPHRDIASRFGFTDGHLYVLLHRARYKVRDCLSV